MVKNGSLKSIVYEELMNGIVRGEYRPGEILTEGRLLERFDCSRAPIREALASLCSEGIIKNLPRFGYEVVRITMDDVRQMLQFRQLLEGGMLLDTSRRFTDYQYDELLALAEECRIACSPKGSMWEHWEKNTNFHVTLLSYSRNEYTVRLLRDTLALLKVAYGQYYWNKWDQACTSDKGSHFRILEALKRHDTEEAVAFLTSDLNDSAFFNG